MSGNPLPVFLVAFAAFAGLAAVTARGSGAASSPAWLSAPAALAGAVAVLAHLYFATVYLQSANYTDHIEPNTAVVSWLWLHGAPVYHALDAPERYAFLYGPLAYLAGGLSFALFGGSVLAAKLPGFVCLLLALGATAAAALRVGRGWVAGLAALGYVSLLALFFRNFSFWSKPDSFLLAAAALGVLACTWRSGRGAATGVGLALGLAVNAKITGGLYFLPLLAWLWERHGLRPALAAGVTGAVLAVLPFFTEQISVVHYIEWLRAAGGHGLSLSLLVQNLLFGVLALVPAAVFAWRERGCLRRYPLTGVAAGLALLLVVVAASKPGSGPHHLLPFLPALGMLAARLAAGARHVRLVSAACAAFALASGATAAVAVYYGLGVVRSHALGDTLRAEIEHVSARYPDRSIYMGYGDGSRYTWTFVRDELAYRGHPYLIDAAAMMDFQLSGVDVPDATVERMVGDVGAVWLIPAGQEPFTIVNWYYRATGGKLFSDEFRQAFSDHYRKVAGTEHYDVYLAREREGLAGGT